MPLVVENQIPTQQLGLKAHEHVEIRYLVVFVDTDFLEIEGLQPWSVV